MNNKNLLPRVWEVNEPYPEVIKGLISEEIFAASLGKVRDKTAESIYQDAQEFYEKTYITDALVKLIQEITDKLNGTRIEYNAVYKLESNFGGGKTHSLIALYHAFSNPPTNSIVFQSIIYGKVLPKNVKIICLDGDEYNPLKGNTREENLTIKTLWGDFAYQLNGKKAYDQIRENDEKQTSPGARDLVTLMGPDPVLILIDEPALYFARAASVVVGNSTLANQTITFLYDLLSAVSKKHNAVVVITLASNHDAFASYNDEISRAIMQAESIISRKAEILLPTKENEMYGIVKKRLFRAWDEKARDWVSKTYFNLYEATLELNAKFKTSEYLTKLQMSYPFHPELFEILETRFASIYNFQKSRGALRLLAKVVADIWNRKEMDSHLILPSFVSLQNYDIQKELTGRIGLNDMILAIKMDIANDINDSKAQMLDREYIDKKLPPLVSRISNAVYLYSLALGKREGPGVERNLLLAGVITPGIKYDTLNAIIDKMDQQFWYFHISNGRCYFNFDPTMNKILHECKGQIEGGKIRERIHKTLANLFFNNNGFKIFLQPNNPSDVSDDREKKLIIIDYNTANIDSTEIKLPNILNQIWAKGKNNRNRIFKNTTFFMVADSKSIAYMNEISKEYEAYELIKGHQEDLARLSHEESNRLEENIAKITQELILAVAKSYHYLIYPKQSFLEIVELDAGTIIDIKRSRQDIIQDFLKTEGKIKGKITAAYTISRAWSSHKVEVSTKELRDWFYQNSNLPFPENEDTIRDMIKDGIQNKIWVMKHDSRVFFSGDTLDPIQISDKEIIVLLEEAKNRNWCNNNGLRCPACNKWPCKCTLDVNSPKSENNPSNRGRSLLENCPKCGNQPCECRNDLKGIKYVFESTKGLPDVIIQEFIDNYEINKPESFEELQIQCDSLISIKSLFSLHSQLPQNKGITVNFSVEKTNESPQTIKQFNFNLTATIQKFQDYFNSLQYIIQNNKMKPIAEFNIELDNVQKQQLDIFFKTLKKYHTVEYKLRLKGTIIPKS